SVVVYRNNERHIGTWNETAPPSQIPELPWNERGVYLITGGAGGLGQVFAREISERARGATIIFTGRSALTPTRLADIETLRAEGSAIHYRQVDIRSEASVDALIRWMSEEVGDLRGVLHCAATVKDGLCLNKSSQEIREVLSPKVAGVINLDRA